MTTNAGRHYRRQNLRVTRGEPATLGGAWVVNPFEAGCAVSGGGFHVLRKPTSIRVRHLHWKCEWVVCTLPFERNDKTPETSRSKNINLPIHFYLYFPAGAMLSDHHPILYKKWLSILWNAYPVCGPERYFMGIYVLDIERTDWVERTQFRNFDKSPANFGTPHGMTSRGIVLLYQENSYICVPYQRLCGGSEVPPNLPTRSFPARLFWVRV